MAGRPTKLTPDVQEKIVQAIRAGNYIETAAAYAGVRMYVWTTFQIRFQGDASARQVDAKKWAD